MVRLKGTVRIADGLLMQAHLYHTAATSSRPAPKRTLTMSFADEPVTGQEVVVENTSQSGSTVTRKSLKRALTTAPVPQEGALGIGSPVDPNDIADFSILRLDLSLGHGQTATSQSGALISSLERSSISRLLSSRLESALSHLKSLQGRIMSTRSRVLVTGDLNAGKSTFVNALLRRGGQDDDGWPTGILPVDQQPLTGRFIEVYGGDKSQGTQEFVHVVKGTEDSYDPLDESTYEKRPVETLMELAAEHEAEAPPLKVFLRAPAQDLINPSILHNGILDISLIDAPGLNRDVIPTTSNFTRSPTIDVIIFVVSAFNHFTLSAKEFILSAGQEKARMFIVVNRFDEVRDKEKCKRVVLDQIKQLSPATWAERDELVHFVDSAKVALRCSEISPESQEDKSEESLDDAFKSLESSLRSFVLINRAKSKLGPAENYLCHLLADVELLASANRLVAEDARDKAREQLERVKPSLEIMLKGSSVLEDSLGEEEERIGGVVDSTIRKKLDVVLSNLADGQLVSCSQVSLPPYPGLLGVWDYAVEVRKAFIKSIEASILTLEQDTRQLTSSSVDSVFALADRHLPKDVEKSKRVFNPQAMFAVSGGKRLPKNASPHVLGLGLMSKSDFATASLSDLFDMNYYILAAKHSLTGSDQGHEGEITVLGVASLAAGAVTLFGGKAMGLRHALESLVSVSDLLGNKTSRQWAGPIAGAVVLGLAAYLVHDLPSAIPRNVGRQMQRLLESKQQGGDQPDCTFTDAQSMRMQREARKVVRLASWDLRERFRAALEEKSKIVQESEAEEKRAAQALEYFGGLHKRANGIKSGMGKSVFA